jgi:hypothetical protein
MAFGESWKTFRCDGMEWHWEESINELHLFLHGLQFFHGMVA